MINTHNGVKDVIPRVDINDFPALKAHLDQHWDKISKRADKGDTPYNLRNCAYLEDFCKPKILWKRIGSILRFSYDETGCMGLDSTCFATGADIAYICCVLNSKVGHYLLKDAPKTGTGDLLISVQAVEPIKIPIPDETTKSLLNHRLAILINSESQEVEQEIYEWICDLYNFSTSERCYIRAYNSKL